MQTPTRTLGALIAIMITLLVGAPVASAQDGGQTEAPDRSTPWALFDAVVGAESWADLLALVHPSDLDQLPDVSEDLPPPSESETARELIEVRTDGDFAAVCMAVTDNQGDLSYFGAPLARKDGKWWILAANTNVELPTWVMRQARRWQFRYRFEAEGLNHSAPRYLLESFSGALCTADPEAAGIREAFHPDIRDRIAPLTTAPEGYDFDVTESYQEGSWAVFLTETFLGAGSFIQAVAIVYTDGACYLVPEEYFDAFEDMPDWVTERLEEWRADQER